MSLFVYFCPHHLYSTLFILQLLPLKPFKLHILDLYSTLFILQRLFNKLLLYFLNNLYSTLFILQLMTVLLYLNLALLNLYSTLFILQPKLFF